MVDQRTLVGAPLWFKPLKFSISIALFALALAWMLGQLRERALRRTGWAIVAGLALEMVIIVGQAARGEKSPLQHGRTALGSMLFAIMGATITVVWFLTLAVALRFLREPGRDRAMTLAIRLGLLVSLVGMAVGFLLAPNGGHAVGVPDGGPGLFFVGWSTTGGDLRISHFVGLHALQVLPLLAALLAHRVGRRGHAHPDRVVGRGRLPRGRAAADLAGAAGAAAVRARRAHARRPRRGRPRRTRRLSCRAVEPVTASRLRHAPPVPPRAAAGAPRCAGRRRAGARG